MSNVHPNATVGAVSSVGGGALVVALAHLAGWNIDPYVAVTIAGGVTAFALAIGRYGLVGIWRGLLHGKNAPKS